MDRERDREVTSKQPRMLRLLSGRTRRKDDVRSPGSKPNPALFPHLYGRRQPVRIRTGAFYTQGDARSPLAGLSLNPRAERRRRDRDARRG